ncbi:ATP-binding protein [Mesorhizobium sp.]|uniref:slr1658 superfamily regulator n=1 Tax=Mesorhizobium sp. TaxID=1871066 RepID=UPI00122642DF|nr:ATP-binding protein [Mesorhizobium sp.]TIS57081.1 MAG: ATP-binding protein [Mesorhizobium sp.]TIS89319.1 MAG: ATP-binding protein [Mesorhizobium sp.]
MTTLFGPADIAIGMRDSVSRVRLFDGPLELSWHHCATTSDFIADLFALPFQASRNDYKEVRHSIGYLVNELVENAMKFRAPGEVLIEASIDSESFKVKVSNLAVDDIASEFQNLLSEITVGDPGELLIQRIEANAADAEATQSGLGLLTLMSDYGARLAWIFSPTEENDRVWVEAYASIPVSNARSEMG